MRTDSLKHHKERRQLFSSGQGTEDAEAALPLLPRLQQSQHRSGSDPAMSIQQASSLQGQQPPAQVL